MVVQYFAYPLTVNGDTGMVNFRNNATSCNISNSSIHTFAQSRSSEINLKDQKLYYSNCMNMQEQLAIMKIMMAYLK